MPVMSEFQAERDTIKTAPFKKKMEYVWEYYKWPIIIGSFIILSVASFIITKLTEKELTYYVCMLNAAEIPDEGYITLSTSGQRHGTNFLTQIGLDPEEYEVVTDSSIYIDPDASDEYTYQAAQKFYTYISTGQIDAIITDETSINRYAYLEYLHDLRGFLTPQQLEQYKDRLFYIDTKTIEERNDFFNNPENFEAGKEFYYPDPTDYESMEDPIPVGIFVTGCKELTDKYAFREKSIVLGFSIKSERPETGIQYLDFLMSDASMNGATE
jgi:hypothetical protein